jgi:hypothetical protein
MPVTGLRTHAPTGRIPWPLILLEGQEKSGRSWSITAIWAGLKDWASSRARSSSRGQSLLRKDPHAEVKISTTHWNDAASRWRKIQTLLATFPGPVIITARGKEVAVIGPDGNPIEGQREWSVDCHKELPYTATAWVRMQRTTPPIVIGARSVHAGIKPGADDPKPITDPRAEGRLLEWLIFDLLRVDAARVGTRDYREFTGGDLTEEEKARPEEGEPDQSQTARRAPAQRGRTKPQWLEAIAACTDLDCTRGLWVEAQRAGLLTADVEGIDLGDRIRARAEDITAGLTTPAEPVSAPVPPVQAPQDVPAPAAAPAAAEEAPSGDQQPAEAEPVEQTPDPDVRPGKLREATLAALAEIYGGDLDVLDAAAQDDYGKPLALIGQRRLSEMLTREQAGTTP